MDQIFIFLNENVWARKLAISVLCLIFAIIIINLINRGLHNRITELNKFYKARKLTYYIVSITYIILMLLVWVEAANSFSTYMGLLSAGIAIAIKDVFFNIAAWLFIIIRRPFLVGDRVIIHNQRGDVIDIRLFQFSLIEISAPENGEQSTGRIIDIPNHYIFLYPMVNYVKGFKYIWNEIKIEITFESDWKKAKREFEKILESHALHFIDDAKKEIKEAARKYMVYYKKFTPIVYTDVRDSGVTLTLRYLCDPKHKRQMVNDIWEDVLELVNSNDDIDLAYPTRRVVN